MTLDQKINGQIQAARVRRQPKITQAQLAELVGMKPATLKNKLRGRAPWRASELETMATALGYPSASDFIAAAEASLLAA